VTVSASPSCEQARSLFNSGNFSNTRQQKNERRVQLAAAYKNQQDKIQQLEAFLSRFRYQATKAKQVQSRIKELGTHRALEVPPMRSHPFQISQPKPSGRVVAEFRSVAEVTVTSRYSRV